MQYQEIRIDLASEHAPPLVELFYERELGFQESDETTLNPPPPGRARFHLYIPREEAAVVRELVEAVHELLPPAAAVDIAVRDRDENEWRDTWKAYFATRRIGRFAIVPSWEAAAHTPAAGEVTITMDPGRAFGTGGHASTRLCLRLLDELAVDEPAPRVLDLGCGCGVLGIAALRAWPEARGVAIDIDPEAVEVTIENADLNDVSDRLHTATTPVAERGEEFALILANITGPTLIELADDIVARLAPGGALILSGVLTTEAAGVIARFAGLGLHCLRHELEEEWSGILLGKSSAAR